jgi:hypothetical protein
MSFTDQAAAPAAGSEETITSPSFSPTTHSVTEPQETFSRSNAAGLLLLRSVTFHTDAGPVGSSAVATLPSKSEITHSDTDGHETPSNCDIRRRLTALALLVALPAGATPSDSLRIVLPRHIRIGVPYTIKLTGYTSTPKSGLQMVAQHAKCAATVTKVPGNAGIVIPGDIVTGHFEVKDRISFPTASHGSVRYCAYMFHASPPSFTNVTLARATARYRIPS